MLSLISKYKYYILAVAVIVIVTSGISTYIIAFQRHDSVVSRADLTREDYKLVQDQDTPSNPEKPVNPRSSNTGYPQSDSTSTSSANPEATPATTLELGAGLPLEYFPFPIMTDPPHSFHDPVTGFASISSSPNGNYEFVLPSTTNDIGLYGQFWLSPTPPTASAQLAGVRITNAAWQGTMDNSLVVFSLLDRTTEDNALGTVTGATQGLANQLVAVLFDPSSPQIDLRLNSPIAGSGQRFVFVVDSENLPTGNPTIFPDSISVGSIEWLWVYP